MTLLYIDGFDVGDIALKWLVYPNALTRSAPIMVNDTPFRRGRAMVFPADFDTIESGPGANPAMRAQRGFTPSAEVFLGFNFKFVPGVLSYDSGLSGSATHPFDGAFYTILHLFTDAGTQERVYLNLRNDGALELRAADGTLLGSSPAAALVTGVWYFLELHVDFAGGLAEVRRNERTVISYTGSLAGGGDGLAAKVMLNGTRQPVNWTWMPAAYYDDLYLCNGLDDGVGPANNSFLGEGRAQTLLPNATGTDTQLAPVGNPANFENVNDVPYSVSDYNTSATVGDRDTYRLDDLDPLTTQVLGVQAVVIAQGTDAAVQIKTALRAGGTLYYDPAVTLDGTPSVASLALREQDPDTSTTWTVPNVNALELGVEITT